MVPTLWIVLAAAITVRAFRHGLPFALTWWSFTFPVGTCVTGTTVLAARSADQALRWASVILYGLLLAAWVIVAVRTARGSASGRLFRPAEAQPVSQPTAFTAAQDLVSTVPGTDEPGSDEQWLSC